MGFVFAPSPRRIQVEEAREIARHLHPSVALVGVFVDAGVDEMLDVVGRVGLDAVQLQGHEPAEVIDELRAGRPGLFITRVLRATDASSLAGLADSLADAVMADSKDASRPADQHGQVPLAWLEGLRHGRLIVAGGLTPDNVGLVVSSLRPWGVDVSSGVEESPGRKDAALVRRFLQAVRAAEALDTRPAPAT